MSVTEKKYLNKVCAKCSVYYAGHDARLASCCDCRGSAQEAIEKAERENAELLKQNEDYDKLGLEVLELKRERDELKAENNLFREWMGSYIEDLKKLVGSSTWKKVVEGSINPNFRTIIERATEAKGGENA